MHGFEAIAAANGWAMAFAGALIVISGLAVLAFVISQLHHILAFFEKSKKDAPPKTDNESPTSEPLDIPDIAFPLSNLTAAATIYRSLTASLGDVFTLEDLHRFFRKHHLPHPHLTIRALRQEGFLAPVGDGSFSWKGPA